MLKPAILYADRMTQCFAEASLDPTNKYYANTYWTFEMTVETSDWSKHQFVSVDKSDNIVAYLSVDINRSCNFVYDMCVIRFLKTSRYDIMFAKDFKKFFWMLFSLYKYDKLEFNVVVGAPHEKMYDKFIKKYNGRIVGTLHKHWKSTDGQICDYKIYEIMRKDLLENARLEW